MRARADPGQAPCMAVAAYHVTSGWGAVVSIVVLGALAILWLVSLFMVIVDRLGLGAKLLWVVFLTVLAPIAIPVYLILRRRRLASA
jgi:hypothetical protein